MGISKESSTKLPAHGWRGVRARISAAHFALQNIKKSVNFLKVRYWCEWKESNLRPLSYQDSVLPLNYTRACRANYSKKYCA